MALVEDDPFSTYGTLPDMYTYACTPQVVRSVIFFRKILRTH